MKKIITSVFVAIHIVLCITTVYASEFKNVVTESERVYYAEVKKEGSVQLDVPYEAFGYFGQCDLDFDGDGKVEHLCLNLKKEKGKQAIYAEMFEAATKIAEFPLQTWKISPYLINEIDISVIYLNNKPIIYIEDNYSGTMATGVGLNFTSIYYDNNKFYEYFSYNFSGSVESEEYIYSVIKDFKDRGFNIDGLKVFDYDDQLENITQQLNSINICKLYISCTSSDPRVLGNLLNNPVPFKYTIYTNLDNVTNYIKVILNGEEVQFDQTPVMINDRVMVPIRAIFEAMGYTVTWNGQTHTAEAIKSNNKITVKINNNIIQYKINGRSGTYKCDVLPQIISGRTLVPVRAIAEAAGCDVQWDGENTTVIITYNENIIN